MLKHLRKKRGQSTLEYAILIAIVIGALVTIQVYIKRGIQGRLRSATDDIGDQFSPGNTNFIRVTKTQGRTQQTFQDGVTESRLLTAETTNVSLNQEIINSQFEFWSSADDQSQGSGG